MEAMELHIGFHNFTIEFGCFFFLHLLATISENSMT